MPLQLILFTSLTMIGFASNSILCRLALRDSANNPLSFTLIRLLSGAIILTPVFIRAIRSEPLRPTRKTILPPLLLFLYALFFSLSYVQIASGTGALILFTSVQLTMMFVFVFRGQTLKLNEKIGFALAACGFVYLLLPGLSMPPFTSATLMGLAGVAWGLYTLMGQAATEPILATARNFIFTAPLCVVILLFHPVQLTQVGLSLAATSGAITSGLAYTLWYAVLKKLQTSTAAIIQLTVPALAAFGGALLLGETPTPRLLIASALIFLGILIKVKKLSPN